MPGFSFPTDCRNRAQSAPVMYMFRPHLRTGSPRLRAVRMPLRPSPVRPQKRASVFRRKQTGLFAKKTLAVLGARCQTRKGSEEGVVASPWECRLSPLRPWSLRCVPGLLATFAGLFCVTARVFLPRRSGRVLGSKHRTCLGFRSEKTQKTPCCKGRCLVTLPSPCGGVMLSVLGARLLRPYRSRWLISAFLSITSRSHFGPNDIPVRGGPIGHESFVFEHE